MRSVVGLGVAAALAMGQDASSAVSPPSSAGVSLRGAPSPGVSPSPSAAPTASTRKSSDDRLPPEFLPPNWKNITSLRVLPEWPRQHNDVRVFVHCPPEANHALVGSTAFNLRGSRRLYREVGIGISKRGLGRDAVSISYYALPGVHEVCLKCVKVKIDHETRIRRIHLISRYSVPIRVRRFDIAQFFAWHPAPEVRAS
ncbi:hypothetical protein [Streptosporangium carneum]|uniref:Uncharacterized protein n=1 Tax=Streptosporangium carneum TaxID=47481 RepID=A0A9W6MB16_9ACTN|nr:hypothetical protein [Streptosporangium carneum]GLK07587.1 hypothetical protein GCM10017600_09920 [Streptosporangium carneum]